MAISDTTSFFDRTAEGFSAKYRIAPEFEERVAVWRGMIDSALAAGAPDSPCLDLGCGDGTLSLLVASRGVRTVGFDQSPAMLALARRQAQHRGIADRVEFVRASLPLARDVEQLWPGTAGLILCSSVLEYLNDPDALLHQCGRLLRPGGTLLLSFPNWDAWYRLWEGVVHRLMPGRDSYVRYQRNRRRSSDIAPMLETAGFRIVQEQRFSLPLQRITAPIFRGYRGRRVATMVLICAQRDAHRSPGVNHSFNPTVTSH
jgi:SAM-dependent methyltransferase